MTYRIVIKHAESDEDTLKAERELRRQYKFYFSNYEPELLRKISS